jgi:T-complex protein 11
LKKDLQDRAVSNELEYFEDRIAKGKIDLTAVINWMEPYIEENSAQPFTAFSKGTPHNQLLTSAFVDFLSPSSSMQFPATFLFDVPRVNNFRKDFRDLVSVQLCLLLYRELSISLHPLTTAPPEESFNALRLEIWSILSDLPEATKYTLASSSLAVQIALRALQHSTPAATLPPAHLVTLAQRWIELNVTPDSKIFGVAERRVQEYFVEHLVWANGTCIPQTPLRACECEGGIVWAVGTESAMWLLAERVHRVAAFHWMVFGQVYVKGCEE